MAEEPRQRVTRPGGQRSVARLSAVQALYQVELAGVTASAVVGEFVKHRLGHEIDGEAYLPADAELFRELVEGTLREGPALDQMITGVLTPDWPLERLEVILRAILRLAAFELADRIEVPVRVIITEYVDIAHAFFAGKEPGLVNGVLDKLGRQKRPTEW
jgi:N utilization substance protein B